MHFLIFLKLVNKFLEASHIDKVICTELSTIVIDSTDKLIKIVTFVILYGLYRKANFHSSCMSNT